MTNRLAERPNPPRWGMVIDVNRCVGCQTCTVACKHWNDTQPGVQWRSVIDVETGLGRSVDIRFTGGLGRDEVNAAQIRNDSIAID